MNYKAVIIVGVGVSSLGGLAKPYLTPPCDRPSLIGCSAPVVDPGKGFLSSTLSQNGIAGDLSTELIREPLYLSIATSSGTGRIQMGDVFTLTGV
jgi:hypothetical protein